MKSGHLFYALALVSVMLLCGCSSTQTDDSRPLSTHIRADVAQIDVIHTVGGQTVQWAAQREEVAALRDWAFGLEYGPYECNEGESPGDAEGGEVYEFLPLQDDCFSFCYVISGENNCYLLMEGGWYSVSNPSAPPVQEPT